MTQWSYLFCLIVSLAGTATLDWRYGLAYWQDRRRTLATMAIGVAVFFAWDLTAIGLGIFKHGTSIYALPLTILPEFPIEELFFLLLLCYCTLVMYRGGARLWRRT